MPKAIAEVIENEMLYSQFCKWPSFVAIAKNRKSDDDKISKLGEHEEIALEGYPDNFISKGERFGSLGIGFVQETWQQLANLLKRKMHVC